MAHTIDRWATFTDDACLIKVPLEATDEVMRPVTILARRLVIKQVLFALLAA
ncbi:hypothetical protein D3C72_2601540 [compost metagenome]